MTESKKLRKIVFIVIFLLILLPLILFILIQFAPPKVNALSVETAGAEESETGGVAARERHARRTAERTARQEEKAASVSVSYDAEPGPEPERFDGAVGAINPNATRTKRATPYPPGEVPGDSGVMVQYAGSPDDMIDAPPPPQGDLWGGRPVTPISPANMRGIGGVRRVDPNDPFFQQDIPNPFNNR